MRKLTIKTKEKQQVVDITKRIEKELPNFEGVCNIFVLHTTAAITTADLDPGTDKDMLDAYEKMLPDLKYRHPHDPSHVKDHIEATALGSNVLVPFKNKKLQLGTWQKVVLFEFNGPRERTITLSFLKDEGIQQ
jgi:secondary thiamine-phosphate synthase enzyme